MGGEAREADKRDYNKRNKVGRLKFLPQPWTLSLVQNPSISTYVS